MLATLAVLCAASDAGCGSGAPTKKASALPPPTAAPSHQPTQFLADASSICKRLSTEVSDPPGTVLDAKTLARLAPMHAAAEYRALRQLEHLTPPPSIRSDWASMLRYRKSLADNLTALGRAAKAEDHAAFEKLAKEKSRSYDALGRLAERAGVGACGKGVTAQKPGTPASGGVHL